MGRDLQCDCEAIALCTSWTNKIGTVPSQIWQNTHFEYKLNFIINDISDFFQNKQFQLKTALLQQLEHNCFCNNNSKLSRSMTSKLLPIYISVHENGSIADKIIRCLVRLRKYCKDKTKWDIIFHIVIVQTACHHNFGS